MIEVQHASILDGVPLQEIIDVDLAINLVVNSGPCCYGLQVDISVMEVSEK